MSLVIGFIVLGLALIMIEIFVPGGIVGTIGGISLLGAVYLSYRSYGADGALITFLICGACVVACLFVEFKILPKTAVGRRLFLSHRVSGKSQQEQGDSTLLGQEGNALTALAPSGYVLVGGRKLEAHSCSGFLEKGEKVRVESIDQFKVTVSKL